jgi:hypothetical protein
MVQARRRTTKTLTGYWAAALPKVKKRKGVQKWREKVTSGHIKNWSKFQHFKDRKPPWIKLYRDLLDDMDWHQLDPKAAKMLVMLWLLASENSGDIPSAQEIAFRLRITEKDVDNALAKLKKWVDVTMISPRYQNDSAADIQTPRRDRDRDRDREETEERKNICEKSFEEFWNSYPARNGKKVGKKSAREQFEKIPVEDLPRVIQNARNYGVNNQYPKDPERFLKNDFWKDWDEPQTKGATNGSDYRAVRASREYPEQITLRR